MSYCLRRGYRDLDAPDCIERMRIERAWRVAWLERRGWTLASVDVNGDAILLRDPRLFGLPGEFCSVGTARLRECARERAGQARQRRAA